MKSNNIIFAAILLFLCNACDMNKEPSGQLDANKPMTLKDCQSYHIGLYASYRGIVTGGFLTYGDIQTDYFHSVLGNMGALDDLYSGRITPGTSEIEDIWGGNYIMIGKANYFLKQIENLQANTPLTDAQVIELDRYKGESLFTRAYCFYDLAQKFCLPYTTENAGKEHGGLPLVSKYAPSDDNSQYPTRGTLQEIYDLIVSDLNNASEYLKAFETKDTENTALPQAMSPWITSDVVKALQARVYLAMGNWKEALEKAEEVIKSTRYDLISDLSYFSHFWEQDYGEETIWRVTMDRDHLGNTTGSLFLANSGYNMAFIPTKGTIDMYAANDNRRKAVFANRSIRLTEANATVAAFTKFPGNPNLFTTSLNNFANMGKPFRIAEQYLIAAEAAAMQSISSKANQHLNTLKSARIPGFQNQQLIGETLIKEIRSERRRELIGEGFRLSDLKRWGEGFERSNGQNNAVINTLGNVHQLNYNPDDYRFVWPIPQGEIEASPQIRNQQNPGYY